MAEEYNKYQDALIYTIKTSNGIYVGSTCNFNKRKSEHKSSIYNENNKYYNIKLYKNIRENEGNWSMEIYKMFPCNNKEELRIEEDKITIEINANLNTNRAFISEEEKKQHKKEWDENNKDKNIEYKKKWRENNRDRHNKISRQHYQNNKDIKITCKCGAIVTKNHLARHKKSKKHLNFLKQNTTI